MEAQSERVRSLVDTPVPPYEAWPSVPKTALGTISQSNQDNAMDLDNVMSPIDRHSRATSTLSMDDIEAAHALEGLRADYIGSPRPSTSASNMTTTVRSSSPSQQPEPLLSLLTSQHPLLSTAINGSLSAYTSSKSYSARFRVGAEFVERNIASPVVNTVGTAGRISGVETGVRWWLQRSDSGSADDGSNKRRRIDENEMDIEQGMQGVALAHRSRAASDMSLTESLPAYDDQRSPRYEEHNSTTPATRYDVQTPNLRNWQTRLMMSTSGLGVAMSDESLRSLKYCLSWLRWANSHLGKVLTSLQSVLGEWEQTQNPQLEDETGDGSRQPRDQATITQHLQALKSECLQTLKNVVDIVSKYAGGALPENARVLVRRHLTSLPQRFRIAASSCSTTAPPPATHDAEKQTPPEIVTSTRKVVVLAKEGLDMMAQVSGIVNGTIVSAEEWCDRLGRKRVRDGEAGEEEKRITEDGEKRVRSEGVLGSAEEKEALVSAVDGMSMASDERV